jgi:hypothetical protein
LLQLLGIKIDPARLLPDIILADTDGDLLFVFVEVVATEGPIHEERRSALLNLITEAGFRPEQAAFLTAFESRNHAAFKRTVASLAWGSFAWCFSEPEHLIIFDGRETGGRQLRDFLPPPR